MVTLTLRVSLPLSPPYHPLSLSSSLASCVMNFPRLPLPNWATGHGSLGYQLSAKAETGAEAEPKLKPVRISLQLRAKANAVALCQAKLQRVAGYDSSYPRLPRQISHFKPSKKLLKLPQFLTIYGKISFS